MKFKILLIICYSHLCCNAISVYNNSWLDMQKVYEIMQYKTQPLADRYDDLFCHEYWKEAKQSIGGVLSGPVNQRILSHPIILDAMVNMGRGPRQEYELGYLNDCISEKTKEKILKYKDASFSGLRFEIAPLRCTTNSLKHLYIAARIFEMIKKPLQTVVEFGGGFGNLVRVFKHIEPTVTYIDIDFPELLALTYLYIKTTSPEARVVVHSNNDLTDLEPGVIHLVPVYYIDSLNVKADAFISSFALSESTHVLQEKIVEKQFFGASYCYLSGQINGWKNIGKDFFSQDVVYKGIRMLYSDVICQPHPVIMAVPFSQLPSYEMLAHN